MERSFEMKKKIRKYILPASACLTLGVTMLSVLAVLFEYEKGGEYFLQKAPLCTVSLVLMILGAAGGIAAGFFTEKRDPVAVPDFNSSVFRFFASFSGCVSLIFAYVRFGVYRVNVTSSDPMALKGNSFTLLTVIFAVLSSAACFSYAFGNNKKRNRARAIYGLAPAVMITFRLMETHFMSDRPMNSPMRLLLQAAIIVNALALLYMTKCELYIYEADARRRMASLAALPTVSVPFVVMMTVGYLTKTFGNFEMLVDAFMLFSLTGLVLSSYMPASKAKVIAEAEWAEYDALVTEAIENAGNTEESAELIDENTENTEEAPESTENTEETPVCGGECEDKE